MKNFYSETAKKLHITDPTVEDLDMLIEEEALNEEADSVILAEDKRIEPLI